MSDGEQERRTAEWQATRTPGPKHELLKKFVGDWTAEMSMRMSAGQPPMRTTGRLKGELMFGGRYVKVEDEGEFMLAPFRDFGLIGYDSYKQKYNAYFCFDTGTQATFVYGDSSADGTALVFHGTSDEPMTGRRDVPMTLIYRFPDSRTIQFEIWMEPGLPQEYKSLEITYTRV